MVEIDTERLPAQANALAAQGKAVGDAVRQLHAEITGAGSPWGDDETGTLFGQAYTELTGVALDAYTALADGLSGKADDVHTMANGFTDRDATSAAAMNAVRRR